MVNQLRYIFGLLLIGVVVGFHVQFKGMRILSQWMKSRSSSLTSSTNRLMVKSSSAFQSTIFKYHMNNMALAETVAPVETATPTSTPVDFSSYAPGQEYQAKLVSAKKFGIFTDIGNGQVVLLPRSLLGNAYEKLRKMVDEKSEEKIRIEIMNVSVANRTLSAKYIGNYKSRPDLSTLNAKELETKQFVATIVGAHDFGVFAEIDELGIEGLIPISKLPEGSSKTNVKGNFKKGQKITVKVETINVEDKKLILSARLNDGRVDVTRVLPSNISPEKWVQGVVQAVNSYGLFVRPAGMDSVGLLHQSRIPRDLVSTLKKIAPVSAETNKSDVESLFQVGDVFKFRVQNVTESGKLELSSLPFRASDEEEEEYNIIEDEDAEDEGKPAGEGKSKRRSRDDNLLAEDSVAEEESSFNANSVLLWWRGKPYVGPSDVAPEEEPADEEIEILGESRDVQEGTWRRLFELDMRQDEADFSVKAMEAELKELDEEIGELQGLDEDLEASDFGLGTKFVGNRIGASVAFSIPAEWRDKLSYLQELDETIKIKSDLLKGGKKADNLEMESVIREAEMENERRNSMSRRVPANMNAEMTGEEVAMEAPAAAPVAPVEVPPPASDAA